MKIFLALPQAGCNVLAVKQTESRRIRQKKERQKMKTIQEKLARLYNRPTYEIANRLEKSVEKAFAKYPQGKALERAEALARRSRDARRKAQELFAKENPCTVYPNFIKK